MTKPAKVGASSSRAAPAPTILEVGSAAAVALLPLGGAVVAKVVTPGALAVAPCEVGPFVTGVQPGTVTGLSSVVTGSTVTVATVVFVVPAEVIVLWMV